MTDFIDEVAFTALASSYPTSSSSLWQHSCVRLLWLPLSACMQMVLPYNRMRSSSATDNEEFSIKCNEVIIDEPTNSKVNSNDLDVVNEMNNNNNKNNNNNIEEEEKSSKFISNHVDTSPYSTSTIGSLSNSSFHTRTFSSPDVRVKNVYNNTKYNEHSTDREASNNYKNKSNDFIHAENNCADNNKGSNNNNSFLRGSVNVTGNALNAMTTSYNNDITYQLYFDKTFDKDYDEPHCTLFEKNLDIHSCAHENSKHIPDTTSITEKCSNVNTNTANSVDEFFSSDRSGLVLQLHQELCERCHIPMRELAKSFAASLGSSSIWDKSTTKTKTHTNNTTAIPKSANVAENKIKENNELIAHSHNPYYNSRATLHFAITDEFGTSQWENMDTHRTIMAVIVVINTSLLSIPLELAVDTVLTVFDAHFKGKVCRCVVINETPSNVITNLPSISGTSTVNTNRSHGLNTFHKMRDNKREIDDVSAVEATITTTSSLSSSKSMNEHNKMIMRFTPNAPIEQIAAQVMDNMAREVISSVCEILVYYEAILTSSLSSSSSSSLLTSNSLISQPRPNLSSLTSLRTPLDKLSSNVSELKRSVLLSRVRKKCADYFLLLGLHDKAMMAYGSTSFGSKVDFLWCSAVVESIAAVRYAQLQPLLHTLPEINHIIIRLQSNAFAIKTSYAIKELDTLHNLLLRHSRELNENVIPSLKGTSVPVSMKQRLMREVQEPLKEHVNTFKSLIEQMRRLMLKITKQNSFYKQSNHNSIANLSISSRERAINEHSTSAFLSSSLSLSLPLLYMTVNEPSEDITQTAQRSIVEHNSNNDSIYNNNNNNNNNNIENNEIEEEQNEEDRWELTLLAAKLKENVQHLLRAVYAELDIYLNEVKRQLRKVTGNINGKLLRDREWELQLKKLSVNVVRVSGVNVFVQGLHEMCAFARSLFLSQEVFAYRLLFYGVVLSLRAGTVRTAISLLCELYEQLRSQRFNNAAALLMIVRACVLADIQVHIPWVDEIASRDLILKTYSRRHYYHHKREETSHGFISRQGQNGYTKNVKVDSSNKLVESEHVQASYTYDSRESNDIVKRNSWNGNQAQLRLLLAMMNALNDVVGNKEFQVIRVQLASQLLTLPYYELLDTPTESMLLGIIVQNVECVPKCYCGVSTKSTPVLYGSSSFSSSFSPSPFTSKEMVSMLLRIPATPFLLKWEAMTLPPHLAPRSVSVAGPVFTFIDTQQLKMTILTLHGKRLHSPVVWTVGDTCSVRVRLFNHLHCRFHITAIALHCINVINNNNKEHKNKELKFNHIINKEEEEEQQHNYEEEQEEEQKHNYECEDELVNGVTEEQPICYWSHNVQLDPLTQTDVTLKVKPAMEGKLRIDGVELLIREISSTIHFFASFTVPLQIPVIERLPHITCIPSTEAIEIFADQTVSFMMKLVNTGKVHVNELKFTAHVEKCQLDDCNGCKERPASSMPFGNNNNNNKEHNKFIRYNQVKAEKNDKAATTTTTTNTTTVAVSTAREHKHSFVVIHKTHLASLSSHTLIPGHAISIPVTLYAPSHIERSTTHPIVFRVDCTLPHAPPHAPAHVPNAVPIFAVIPRRVTETRIHITYSPSIELISLSLSANRRFVLMRLANYHNKYNMLVKFSELRITDLHDILIPARQALDVPAIELTELLAYLSSSRVTQEVQRIMSEEEEEEKEEYKKLKMRNKETKCNDTETNERAVPWIVPELPNYTGRLKIDFTSVTQNACIVSELLDDCVITVDFGVSLRDIPTNIPNFTLHWQSSTRNAYPCHPAHNERNKDNSNECDMENDLHNKACNVEGKKENNNYRAEREEDRQEQQKLQQEKNESEQLREYEKQIPSLDDSLNDDYTNTQIHHSCMGNCKQCKNVNTYSPSISLSHSPSLSSLENSWDYTKKVTYDSKSQQIQYDQKNNVEDQENETHLITPTTTTTAAATITATVNINDTNSNTNARNREREFDKKCALPIILPVMCSIRVHILATAIHWKRALPLHINVRLRDAIDSGILSGSTDFTTIVGDNGNALYEEWFELIIFHTGKHVMEINISDENNRKVNHAISFYSL